MTAYRAPLREMEFLLKDVLDLSRLDGLGGLTATDNETLLGVASEAGRLIESGLAPLRASSDMGCHFEGGQVRTPEGYPAFYRQFREAGWCGIAHAAEYGGAELPFLAGKIVDELLCSANVAFALYPGLTASCAEAIEACASDELKQRYLPKLISGEWAGTMCLTEPQAGSDLAAVRARAVPQADGSYSIDGSKIFISSGEHDLTDNIVHFVLARLPDAPPGIRGLSTFIVPKFLPGAEGSPGVANAVRCVSIEHKMGLNGSATCAMAFEGATGWLAGEANHGIQNMFVMMNMARIMVGIQGLGLCELATQAAIGYALERKQGKALNGGEFIVDHPDVRRMLLHMRAVTEGARLLTYETAMQVDLARHHPDPEIREEAQDWVELNTPLVKSFCTDSAVELGSLAIQVHGGHGYIREQGVEQILRDAKILCLYEGTNGIQAMDLVRRKLQQNDGRAALRFFDRVGEACDKAADDSGYIVGPLRDAVDALRDATSRIQQSIRDGAATASAFGCVDYLRAFSLTYLGYNWLRMAEASVSHPDVSFRDAKRAAALYFSTRQLTQVSWLCANTLQSADELMRLPVASS